MWIFICFSSRFVYFGNFRSIILKENQWFCEFARLHTVFFTFSSIFLKKSEGKKSDWQVTLTAPKNPFLNIQLLFFFFKKSTKNGKKTCAKKVKKLWFWHPPYFFTFFFQNDAPDAKTRRNRLTFKKWILSWEGAENHEKTQPKKINFFSHKNQYTNIWFF